MSIPNHVIIMDGNGRWAKQRRLPVIWPSGRCQFSKKDCRYCGDIGIKILTVYALAQKTGTVRLEKFNI